MKNNIFQILKSGNQELFYSSFISWLLDPKGEHGLCDAFSRWFLQIIGIDSKLLSIDTETRIKGGRADIELVTEDNKHIIIENKTKSLGTNEQIKAYEHDSKIVVPLGMFPENYPTEIRNRVVSYNQILEFLKSTKRESTSLSVLVEHFILYLDSVLSPFSIFHKFCLDKYDYEQAKSEISKVKHIYENDNDIRFFRAIYFERLLSYISSKYPILIFGDSHYYDSKKQKEKPVATKWIIEKNTTGNVYFETIIYNCIVPEKISLKSKWSSQFKDVSVIDICPRIELWIDAKNLFNDKSAGIFLLGCWDGNMHDIFSASKEFNYKGSRNFHHRILMVNDLRYEQMANIIMEEMKKIWDFNIIA